MNINWGTKVSKTLNGFDLFLSRNVIFRVVLQIASKPIGQMSLCIVNMWFYIEDMSMVQEI